jgi:hypothetical protein
MPTASPLRDSSSNNAGRFAAGAFCRAPQHDRDPLNAGACAISVYIDKKVAGRFLKEVDYGNLPAERHILVVGKFLKVGQVRKDFVPQIERGHTK